jgi:hypothetical protein
MLNTIAPKGDTHRLTWLQRFQRLGEGAPIANRGITAAHDNIASPQAGLLRW